MPNALTKISHLEQDASNFGLNWENTDQIMEQILSEVQEIKEQLESSNQEASRQALQEEIGDLIHAAFSLCVFCNFEPQETLIKSLDKFERRLTASKELAKAKGLTTLKGLPFHELMLYWKKAKAKVG